MLICPVRPGDNNEELRFALRSWETNLHLGSPLQLLTVGYKPSWLDPDLHVEGNLHSSMPFNVFDNVRLGAEHAQRFTGEDHEEALYMNDDFFCLDPVGAVLPVRRNITLAEHIAKFPTSGGTWWAQSLRLTASWLSEVGFPQPPSFEVHRPLPATLSGMIEALSRWDMGSGDMVPQWRTVYGVLNRVDAYPVVDAKLGTKQRGVGTPWVSTSDQTWRIYAASIRQRFQKPSRWERD